MRTGDTPLGRAALATLCAAYWYPVYAYVRRCGQSAEDAADLTQAFFAHLVEARILARADPDRGKLRTFLLTAMQHFLRDDWRKQQRLKRGGGELLSIDSLQAEHRYALEPVNACTPETLYHRGKFL